VEERRLLEEAYRKGVLRRDSQAQNDPRFRPTPEDPGCLCATSTLAAGARTSCFQCFFNSEHWIGIVDNMLQLGIREACNVQVNLPARRVIIRSLKARSRRKIFQSECSQTVWDLWCLWCFVRCICIHF